MDRRCWPGPRSLRVGGAGGIEWGPETNHTRVHGPGWATSRKAAPRVEGVPRRVTGIAGSTWLGQVPAAYPARRCLPTG